MERFEGLKMETNEWELLLNSQVIPPIGIDRQFESLELISLCVDRSQITRP